ncbi:MAG: glycoside hydrolase family 3 N-terminal domain-containing protein [Chloroflexota bacterium]
MMTPVQTLINPRKLDDAVETRVDNLLKQMNLSEKIGQMTQVEKNSIKKGDITKLGIGSILSGGGGNPTPNTPENWRDMVNGFIEESLESRLKIPLIYGSDCVHGHNNCVGATIFPHNVSLGAADDEELVEQIASATATEMKATGVRWNFAPAVSLPLDLRWGRSYEGFSQDPSVISKLATAYVRGLIQGDMEVGVLPSVKHFVGDGAATWGSSTRISADQWDLIDDDPTLANAKVGKYMLDLLKLGAWKIDQGVSDIDEETLRSVHLPPYVAAIEAGAMNIMASYSSWGGLKMHEQKYLLTDVLKGEMGFTGFVVTDWEAIDQVDPDLYTAIAKCINAGIDMNMVPFRYENYIKLLTRAVESGDVPMTRIDDAVRRILRVKVMMGVFEQPYCDVSLSVMGCDEHRELARKAVRKTLTLLKNENNALPISKESSGLLVAGRHADDVGLQCGGWTIEWMGGEGAITPGTTILQGMRELAGDQAEIVYDRDGNFGEIKAETAFVVVGEEPYAEGMGDRSSIHLAQDQIDMIKRVRQNCENLVVMLVSGRPLIISDWVDDVDAFIAGWLPGTEGDGVADVLFGDHAFEGKLQYTWPRSMDQIPLGVNDEQPAQFLPGDEIS